MSHVANTIVSKLYNIFVKATQEAFPELSGDIELVRSSQDTFGHYQFNSAMKMSKMLKMLE